MIGVLNEPFFKMGFLFGVVAFTVMWIISYIVLTWNGSMPKWRKKNLNSLVGKLRASGYTVYTPSVISSQLDLKTPLTHDDEVTLVMERLVVFDPQGKTVTGLLPLTSESERTAEYRRGQFKVITGGKHDQ